MTNTKGNELIWVIFVAIFCISLLTVTSQCPQNCESCSDTFKCLSCKLGTWGTNSNCIFTCSNICANSSCDDNGFCNSCVNSMYGPNCNLECSLCKNGECGLRECTSGCKTGYFQYISGDYSYCYPCQDTCQQCQNYTYCTLCDAGYYVTRYTINDIETKRGGAICNSCQLSHVCDQCSQLPNCLQCSNSEGALACEHCVEGYTLDNHQCVKNIACPLNCLNGCTPNGVCNGCIDGKAGNTCVFFCSGGCSKCSQTNQVFCTACKDGYYTSTCDISCPQNCATRQCDFIYGSCLNGCLSGYWGDKCEYICSDHCKQSECNRNGTCKQGCTNGYSGLYCNITMTTTKPTVFPSSLSPGIVATNTSSESSSSVFIVNNCQEGSSISGPVLGGAVSGAVLITALLVASIAYFLHRRYSLKTTNKELIADTMYYNTCSMTTANNETVDSANIVASEITTVQTLETSPYEQLSATNTEHAYSGL